MMCEDYPCCGHGPGETGGDGGFKVIRPAAGSFARKVLSDPGTHNWVKDQFIASLDRDPVDALADARLLLGGLS